MANLRRRTGASRRGFFGLVWRGLLALALAAAVALLGLFAIDSLAPPISTLMIGRMLEGRGYTRDYVRLADIAPVAVASVVGSEDAQFCRNDGVDWGALHEVLEEADGDGPSRGASTITMQTAKNLFLWPSRSSVRKGIEIAMALALGKVWSKAHTIEVYLNIAEWGDGIFGIEAASHRYFGKSAAALNAQEAALLAVSLPSPIKRDPAHPRQFQRRLAANIVRRARGSGEWLGCLPGQ